jgi:hypothetical protein
MKKQSQSHRIIATFFLLIFFPTLVPTNLFASNNGPTAPEATAFEPVDAKDMVNLSTGDMSYVLPLLNVPSPEGGYPLSLSNHAGIAIDQEASWVGLGWSLNPGAINRGVTGVPDDWKESKISTIVYDAGGSSNSYNASISVGWGGKGGFSAGLYGSYTENKTFGGSTSYSSDFGAQGSAGPFNASLGTDGVGVGAGPIGINQSFKNGSFGASLSASFGPEEGKSGPTSSLGINWNSSYGYSASIGSQQFLLSSGIDTPKLNISTEAIQANVQIYAINIGLGYSKTRYWTFEQNSKNYAGSLYAGHISYMYDNDNFPATIGFDSYNSIYKLAGDDQLLGDNLSNIAYDYYSVSGQGMSGSFKPQIFEPGTLIGTRTSTSSNGYLTTYRKGVNNSFSKKIDTPTNDIHFYFDNEPSSYLKVPSTNWTLSSSATPEQITAPNALIVPGSTNTIIDGNNGYNSATKRKRTGSFIETFTNQEINTNPASIIIPDNYSRIGTPNEGIGAFKITAIDGKVYHYSIPVYQKEQVSVSSDLASNFSNRYYEEDRFSPYATHWLLTAITGPDYVDVNLDNKVGVEDYGYWTQFDYGKWSDGFVWGTPVKSNDKTKTYEWGAKEIYYLDKIKTRTHTALFIKEVRADDKSYSFQIGNNENDLSWNNTVRRDLTQGRDNYWYYTGVYGNIHGSIYGICDANYGRFIKATTHSSLRLNKILLLKNDDVISTPISKVNTVPIISSFTGRIKVAENFQLSNILGQDLGNQTFTDVDRTWYGEYYNNLYDIADVTTTLEAKALKTIKFNTSYELAKGSRNTNAAGSGRLTLESVDFLGRNNAKIIPSYKFGYINTRANSQAVEDNWGYYNGEPYQWSLNKVSTPTGAEINIQYESDDIDKEAVISRRGLDTGLQFNFGNNGNLIIDVHNEWGGNAINFQDHFEVGTTAYVDLWTSFKHDYDDWGCETRKASVDVNSNVQVIGVSPSNVVFQTSMGSCYESNGGLGWLFARTVGLNNHADMIREDFKRGEWGEPPGCVGDPTDRLVLVYKLLGNKTTPSASKKNGGGIRVREIQIKENNIVKGATKYFYNVPGFGENKADANYKSSGITSYIPEKYFKEIKYKTELPSPGVMYEYVTVKYYSATGELGNTEQYNFEV